MSIPTVDVVRVQSPVSETKLGLLPLVALVVGSMIGGVFSLPQNMAKGASPGAVMIGRLITGVGMLALAFVYQSLSTRKPALDAGPYAYARAGFGDFVGFNSGWGCWLSSPLYIMHRGYRGFDAICIPRPLSCAFSLRCNLDG